MQLLLLFTAVILTTSASTDEDLWVKFKQDYGKSYKSFREDRLRFEIFKSTLKTIENHNAKYENNEESWFMAVNQFSDLTDEEFKALHSTFQPMEDEHLEQITFNVSAPVGFDWRSKGVVRSVKNQFTCGGCWAFSATGALEGQIAIKHGIKTDLSPQELIDCANGKYGNKGCGGGLMTNAYSYVRDHGISTLSTYPYVAHDEACKSQTNSAKIKVTGSRGIARSEEQLRQAVASAGPISVGVEDEKFKHYGGGIFDNPACGNKLAHAVLVVGYGTEGQKDFWIIKNSWGSSWGEGGYIRIVRNKGQCGIALMASYPAVA